MPPASPVDRLRERPYAAAVNFASDFAAFYAEHERCRALDGSTADSHIRVTLTCSCGAVFTRLVQDLHPNDRPGAQFRRGLNCVHDRDYAGAVRSYRLAALQGHADAQNNLGVLCARGTGVPQDYIEAWKWFRRAAQQGHAGAQFNLGRLYTVGHGVQQSDAEAAKWFRRAAEHGFADAQMDLGYMYARGLGVPQDWVAAHMWFALAASLAELKADRDNAAQNQAIAASRMTAAQIAEALRRAREWRLKPEFPRSPRDGYTTR